MNPKALSILSRSNIILPLLCMLFSTLGHAQVRVIDRPYRATPQQAPAPASGIPFDAAPSAQLFQPAPTAAQPLTPQLQRWEVLPEDRKLSRALLRWATQERLQFFYEAPQDPVAVRATYFGTFDQAVPELMDDTQVSGYPLRACRYNNALRVRHASQSCPAKQTSNEK